MPKLPGDDVQLLRKELKALLKERESMLRVVGAATVFVTNMDAKSLPQHVYDAADILATMVNALPDEVLEEALEAVKAEVALDVPDRRKQPRA